METLIYSKYLLFIIYLFILLFQILAGGRDDKVTRRFLLRKHRVEIKFTFWKNILGLRF